MSKKVQTGSNESGPCALIPPCPFKASCESRADVIPVAAASCAPPDKLTAPVLNNPPWAALMMLMGPVRSPAGVDIMLPCVGEEVGVEAVVVLGGVVEVVVVIEFKSVGNPAGRLVITLTGELMRLPPV